MSTKRVKFVVAYDGTDFRGWAAQTGRRTVQGTLTEAVRQVSGEEIEIVGASRTDSGAHAKGQVCHFDLSARIPMEKWPKAANRFLPLDVRVLRAQSVGEDFHSRFCAWDREYRYQIALTKGDPFLERYAYGFERELDLGRMRDAAKRFVGRHDFRAFTEELSPEVENTVRVLRSVEVSQCRSIVRIDIVGTAFLRGMMRRISGALFEIGRGKREISWLDRLLGEERDEEHWPVVLPARGLTLQRIRYGRHPVDHRRKSTAFGNDLTGLPETNEDGNENE